MLYFCFHQAPLPDSGGDFEPVSPERAPRALKEVIMSDRGVAVLLRMLSN